MKKSLLLFLLISTIYAAKSQTLFTYGSTPVSASEFLKAYNKNKTDEPDKEAALRKYLNLYTLFKLKVQAAKDAHLDTLPALQADLQSFRSQIEENYLKDEEKVNALINEAFERGQKDIHVWDYYMEPASNTDSIRNLKTVNEIQLELKSDKKTVAEIIAAAKTKGMDLVEIDFGFITVFTLPYDFENIAYQLKPGEISEPHRNNKGWHILKNIEERPAVGKIKLAQILIAAPPEFDHEKTQAKKLADSLYNALQSGADFAQMAKQFSNDRTSYMSGGELPEFGVGKYSINFEKAAFSLSHDNEISKPFETHFGFHIIKRISSTPVPSSKDDEAFMYLMKDGIMKDSRIEMANQQFIKDILPKIGFKENKVSKAGLWKVSDSSLANNKNVRVGNVDENTILFSFNNHQSVNVSDWVLYIRNSGKIVPAQMHGSYKKIWPEFIGFAAKENYRKRLEDFSPVFKDQLQEFKEGNMLFEVMERNVWGKAATDSAGLLNYYNTHKGKYKWEASADAILFYCANANTANNIIKSMQADRAWKDMVNDNSTLVQADSGRFELARIPVVDKTNFTEGLITAPVVNKNDGTAVFAKILKMYPANELRKFEDARGFVISDYQNVLEEKWIEALKKQYPITVNEKVFKSLLE